MPERVALEPKVMTNKIIFSSEEQKKSTMRERDLTYGVNR